MFALLQQEPTIGLFIEALYFNSHFAVHILCHPATYMGRMW